ncbi:MAG: LptF/LptG family permease, partial [Pseudomonadota bacterium]
GRPGSRLSVTRFDTFSFDLQNMTGVSRPGRPEPRTLATATLLRAAAEDLERTGATRAEFLFEANDRFSQPLLAWVASVLGFSVMMVGGFSRFGFFKQVAGAIVLLAALKSVDNAMVDLAIRDEALWPLVYMPSLLGLLATASLLWMASHPGIFRRRRNTEGELAGGVAT